LYAAVIVVVLIVLYSAYYKTEQFVDDSPHPTEVMFPRVNNEQIAGTKQGIKELIVGRPDVVNAAKQILNDPDIAPTVKDILGIDSVNEHQYANACGCQPENECDCY
jgi:hypothetical protein